MSRDRISAEWTRHYQSLWELSRILDRVPKDVIDALWHQQSTGARPPADIESVVGLIMLRVLAEFRAAERRFRSAGAFDEVSFARYADEVQSIHDRWSLGFRSLADLVSCA